MYEMTCRDCLLSRENAPDDVDVPALPDQVHNPVQRYLCPVCGYAWTDRPGEKIEDALLSLAGNVLAVAVALLAIHLGLDFLGVLLAVALTYGAIHTTEHIRSAVEGWLDPADSVTRRV
jgi:transposase-like protein